MLFCYKSSNMVYSQSIVLSLLFIGVSPKGIFDFDDLKDKILQSETEHCPSNGPKFQYLLNIVCSLSQPTNVTAKDSCVACFLRITSMPEGPQELKALSMCAVRYVAGIYADCAKNLMTLADSSLNVQTSGCFMGYCDFVRCVKNANSMNLLLQCTREVRRGINLLLDADNIKYYKDVTSCILAKTRCDSINPITGEPQVPGYTKSGARFSTAVQISGKGSVKVVGISSTAHLSHSFCTMLPVLSQSSWSPYSC